MSDPVVTVWVSGQSVSVPEEVYSHFAARGALGIPRGVGVARELGDTGMPDGDPLAFLGGHEFKAGDRYILVPWPNFDSLVDPEAETRHGWEQDPDAWKQGGAAEEFIGEPSIEDETIESEEWGLLISLPQFALQVHDDIEVAVAVLGPGFREMVVSLAADQDRLAWSLSEDSPEQARRVREALERSRKITPEIE